MTVKLILPFPSSKKCGANKRSNNWQTNADYIKSLRDNAKQTAEVFIEKFDYVLLDYVFYVPDLQARDMDDMIIMAKHYVDGCRDAGLIKKDDWQHLHIKAVSVFVDRLAPRVELIFSEWVK